MFDCDLSVFTGRITRRWRGRQYIAGRASKRHCRHSQLYVDRCLFSQSPVCIRGKKTKKGRNLGSEKRSGARCCVGAAQNERPRCDVKIYDECREARQTFRGCLILGTNQTVSYQKNGACLTLVCGVWGKEPNTPLIFRNDFNLFAC